MSSEPLGLAAFKLNRTSLQRPRDYPVRQTDRERLSAVNIIFARISRMPDTKQPNETPEVAANHIRDIIADDVASGRTKTVVTRFPPEPNGYLHIGHAKSICLNFGMAKEFSGRCHLRFDDTNPTKEKQEFSDAIEADVRWLGFNWGSHLYYASDNFEQLYDWAVHLMGAGKAYVDDLTADEIRDYRGTLTEPGRDSPHRDRPIEENLDLFARMRAGEFADGSRVVRAKIDMASGNINLRDPVMYRILRATHPRTADAWCIYPTYDFAHGQSDAIEGVTHSICTLEFEDHRPLYDWYIDNLPVPSQPRQYEFARLNLSYTVLSKRHLTRLVEDGYVDGWDDPRMPTLSGLRRRGYPPEVIRDFVNRIGVARRDALIEIEHLEACAREYLNRVAPRYMAVLRPLKVVIKNYPKDQTEELDAVINPEDPSAGKRKVPFARELYIERDDFMQDPPKKFFRLAPGREVRLRYAYFITCTDVIKDESGEVVELRCTYDPETKGGNASDGRKVKATLHWVSASHAKAAEVRLFDRLFLSPRPGQNGDFVDDLNAASVETLTDCMLEPALPALNQETTVQFERLGYFCIDREISAERASFNRTTTLRDTWAKIQAQKGK
jgi:glutaminyl-tRNA synthetase